MGRVLTIYERLRLTRRLWTAHAYWRLQKSGCAETNS